MEDSSFQRPSYTTTYSYEQPRKPKRSLRLLAIGLILLGTLLFGAYMVLGAFGGSEEEVVESTPAPTEFVFPTDEPTVTPTPEPTLSPTVTPKATPPVDKTSGLNRSLLSIEVQNGSGEVGVASKMSDFLKGLGYKVTKIGNAPSFDYEGVTVQVTSTRSAYLNVLKKDLTTSYTVSSASANLTASTSAEAVVIIGK